MRQRNIACRAALGTSGALALPTVLLLLAFSPGASAAGCHNEAIREAQHSTFLPDCRAYEMVSPPQKNGGGVDIVSPRTRTAADGSAVDFISLTPFPGATGSSIGTDYLAERAGGAAGPLGTGWTTHTITPSAEPLSFGQAAESEEPSFMGDFDPAFELGVLVSSNPLTADPDVAGVPNLYLDSGLRSAVPGGIELLTACPNCRTRDEAEGPGKGALRPPETPRDLSEDMPTLVASNIDERRFLFESGEPLTTGTTPHFDHLFEYHAGVVTLVAQIPSAGASECDDLTGPACKPGPISSAGEAGGTPGFWYNGEHTLHPLSDGSDGHSRAFFTLNPGVIGSGAEESYTGGRLFLREDGHYTAQLNASERQVADPNGARPAVFRGASSNGERAFFTSTQALTETAPVGNTAKLYEYDATKPGSDPHNLTYIAEEARSVIGISSDGSYVYFEQRHGTDGSIQLWHDGTISLVVSEGSNLNNSITDGLANGYPELYASRVTPDGRWLLFETGDGAIRVPGRLSVYNASSSTPVHPNVVCVSCLPSGETGTSHVFVNADVESGHVATSSHESHALSDDGRYVFFTTAAPLVADDHNNTPDVYEYDTAIGTVSLLSSGAEDEGSSWFLDASTDGQDVFFVTEQPLVGWDTDAATDLYDARVDGGFAEPVPAPVCASGDSCAGTPIPTPPPSGVGSSAVLSGNPPPPPPPPSELRCPAGQHVSRVNGQLRCVRPPCPKGKRLERIKHHNRCVAVLHKRRKTGGAR
jgi:hypothetical protein